MLCCPDAHPLPRYLNEYPYYDRLLPILARSLRGPIIDIGANIGDTALSIAANSDCLIVSVEPDPKYLEPLRLNVVNNNLEDQVRIYPYAISQVPRYIALNPNPEHSTTRVSFSGSSNDILDNHGYTDQSSSSKTFRDLIIDNKVLLSDISLVKIDVDSMDWDCLNAFAECIEPELQDLPIIYFELCAQDPYGKFELNIAQKLGSAYSNAFEGLIRAGYSSFFLFDNYGIPILCTDNLSQIRSMIDYLHLSYLAGRIPFSYFDVACCTSSGHNSEILTYAIECLREIGRNA